MRKGEPEPFVGGLLAALAGHDPADTLCGMKDANDAHGIAGRPAEDEVVGEARNGPHAKSRQAPIAGWSESAYARHLHDAHERGRHGISRAHGHNVVLRARWSDTSSKSASAAGVMTRYALT